MDNSIQNAVNIGANAFALFLKSQRKWESPPLAADAKKKFLEQAKASDYDVGAHILPHGSYLVNLAQADAAKAKQAYTSFVDDLQRCEQLGIKLYNFHPGNTGGEAREEACGRIAAQLNAAHKATKSVVTVLENMAGAGNVIGTKFEDLKEIIDKVEDKKRVGVCIDTCHAFAAGYDLRTPEVFGETIKEFDEVVGNKYLKAFHRELYLQVTVRNKILTRDSQRQQGTLCLASRSPCQHWHRLPRSAGVPHTGQQ